MAQINSNQNNGVKKQEALTKLRMHRSFMFFTWSGIYKNCPYVSC